MHSHERLLVSKVLLGGVVVRASDLQSTVTIVRFEFGASDQLCRVTVTNTTSTNSNSV